MITFVQELKPDFVGAVVTKWTILSPVLSRELWLDSTFRFVNWISTLHFICYNNLYKVNYFSSKLRQKLWRLNWTNLFDRSTNQPLFFPLCLLFCNFSKHSGTFDFSRSSPDQIIWLFLYGRTASRRANFKTWPEVLQSSESICRVLSLPFYSSS